MKKLILLLIIFTLTFTGVAMSQSSLTEEQIREQKIKEKQDEIDKRKKATINNPIVKTTATPSKSITNFSTSAVPSGAVMAFDLRGRCPSGWSKWNKASGRVIVGAGKIENRNYNHLEVGGIAKQTISMDNIKRGQTKVSGNTVKAQEDFQTPPQVLIADTSVYIKNCVDGTEHCKRYPKREFTMEIGSDDPEAIDNMQPFVALTYCRKN